MPLFYQHTINQTTKLGIWQINEPEDFFLTRVPLQKNITHPHKRLQHLAGRYLLQYLFPDFPYTEILIADTRKPYLQNELYHFSISHCGNYAAAIVSATQRVGIDIEISSEKVNRIAHKFIHPAEQQWISKFSISGYRLPVNDLKDVHLQTEIYKLKTIIWSSKEAIFKWYSLGEVDFKEHIQLNNVIQQRDDSFILPFIFKKESAVLLNITAKIFESLVLSWIAD